MGIGYIWWSGGVRAAYAQAATRLNIPCAGWLAAEEAQCLFALAEAAPGPIVEIGTYLGLSTCYLAGPRRQPVVTIDPHCNEFRNPTQLDHVGAYDTAAEAAAMWAELGVDGLVTQVQDTSVGASALKTIPQSLGLVFIDGDHRPEPCALDLALWGPRVMPGGYLAVHDWGVPGDEPEKWDVAGCCARYIAETGLEWTGPVVCGSVAYWRREA